MRKGACPGQKGAVRDPPLGKAQQGALARRCPGHAWHTRDAEKNGHEGGRTISGRRNNASALPGLTALGGSATRRSLCSSLATYPCLSGLHIIHAALIEALCGRCTASTFFQAICILQHAAVAFGKSILKCSGGGVGGCWLWSNA